MIQAFTYWIDAAILTALAFTLYQLSLIGRHLMSTQEQVDQLTVQVVKINDEVKASAAILKEELSSVKEQLAAANVPAETVDLTALAAAIQAVDDINPDPAEEPVVEEPVEEPVTEVLENDPPF